MDPSNRVRRRRVLNPYRAADDEEMIQHPDVPSRQGFGAAQFEETYGPQYPASQASHHPGSQVRPRSASSPYQPTQGQLQQGRPSQHYGPVQAGDSYAQPAPEDPFILQAHRSQIHGPAQNGVSQRHQRQLPGEYPEAQHYAPITPGPSQTQHGHHRTPSAWAHSMQPVQPPQQSTSPGSRRSFGRTLPDAEFDAIFLSMLHSLQDDVSQQGQHHSELNARHHASRAETSQAGHGGAVAPANAFTPRSATRFGLREGSVADGSTSSDDGLDDDDDLDEGMRAFILMLRVAKASRRRHREEMARLRAQHLVETARMEAAQQRACQLCCMMDQSRIDEMDGLAADEF